MDTHLDKSSISSKLYHFKNVFVTKTHEGEKDKI